MTISHPILHVEDREEDVFLLQHAFRKAEINNPVHVVKDGGEAIEYLSGTGKFRDRNRFPLPCTVLLDLKLPRKTGLEVLEWIRKREDFENMVVLVLTSSNEPSDLNRAYKLGANSYLVKPPTAMQLLELAKAFKWYWLEFNRYEGSATAPK